VLVLGLGIGGATTQFTVVNAVVLRGLSFPHPEQLVTIGLIDPKATDQNNNFGFGVIPTAQDYEVLKANQKSCSLMAGYLSGSTINVTYKKNPLRHRRFFQDYRRIADSRTRLHLRGQQTRRGTGNHSRLRNLETGFQRRSHRRRTKRSS
jgi:hypothetical protein